MKDVCPVCGTVEHTRPRCAFKLGEDARQFDAERLAVWRDDRSPYQQEHEYPTVSTVITCAEDLTHFIVGDNVLVIGHVRNFNGKGFMPKYYQIGERWISNGNVFKTYEEAVEKGQEELRAIVKKQDEDFARWMAEQEALRNEPLYFWYSASYEESVKTLQPSCRCTVNGERRPYSYANRNQNCTLPPGLCDATDLEFVGRGIIGRDE